MRPHIFSDDARVCFNIESLTDKNDGEHVPGSGEHAGGAEHGEIEHLPSAPITQPTQSLVQLHAVGLDYTSSILCSSPLQLERRERDLFRRARALTVTAH